MEAIASLSSARMETALSNAPIAAAPNAAAVQQFTALMQAPAPEAASAAVQTIGAQAAALGPLSMGDRMLNSMQSVSTEFRENMMRVSDTLRSDQSLNGQQMAGLVMEMNVVGMQMQFATTLTSVLTQKFNELTHLQ